MKSLLPSWDIAANVARALHDRAAAAVDLYLPSLGVCLTAWDGQALSEFRMLGVVLNDLRDSPDAANALDAYVRQSDLVATYPPSGARSSRVQVYWRLGAADVAPLAFDLQVSVQTPLLDAVSALQLASLVPTAGGQVLSGTLDRPCWTPAAEYRTGSTPNSPLGCVVCRLAECGLGYVEMIHPQDGCRLNIHARGQGVEIAHRVFEGRLEKGVILRARLRGLLLEGTDALPDAALDAYRQFIAEPLPLST